VAQDNGILADVLGETIPGLLEINLNGKAAVSAKVSELRAAYEGALEAALRADPQAVVAE
jgi:hypothetical protein